MQYHVCQNTKLDLLMNDVEGFLERGWKPQGGIQVVLVSTMPTSFEYYQAITKED